MAEKEQTTPSQTEGQQGQPAPTQEEKTVSMSSYQTLQRDLQKTKDALKLRELKDREGESVEQALIYEREEKASLERELKIERVKRQTPADKHAVIDRFVEKHGFVPDAEDLELLTVNGTPQEEPQSSGVRNSPASRGSKPNFDDDDYLRSVKLDSIS